MSFFDDSSLAFLPSGAAGKDGKAYSIKPTDGTGDFTFSRGSNLAATRVGADGLIEKGRENLFTQSNNFSATPWTSSGTTETSGQSGYDGSSDAWLLSAANAGNFIYRNDITSLSGVNTISVYAKKGTADGIRLRFNQTTDVNLYINLAAGAIIGAFSPGIAYAIEDALNGWYRVQMSFIASGVTDFRIYPTNATGTSIAGTIYIQDAQMEIGLAATDYIESGATTGKAGLLEDEPRFDYSGGATCPSLLLEPSRTNLIKYSEYLSGYTLNNSSIETNSATSPEGVSNATRFIEDTSTGEHRILYSTIATSSGADYAYSFFVKANGRSKLRFYSFQFNNLTTIFDFVANNVISTSGGTSPSITSESYGNDWYRVSISDTTTAVNLAVNTMLVKDDNSFSYAGDGTSGVYFYGFQVEAGSYPTSYIPNHSGGSVTRGADVCNSAGDSSTFNDSEGVLYAEISALANDGTNRAIAISDGSTSNVVRFYYSTTDNRIVGNVKSGGTTYFDFNNVLVSATDFLKVAVSYKINEFKMYVNGALVVTDTSGNTPIGLNELALDNGFGNDKFYGKVNQVIVFPTALSDSDLTTLTTL